MRAAARIDGVAWVMLAALLVLGAIVVTAICNESGAGPAAAPLAGALDWQPALGLREPWRLWTCAWVHWSMPHLLVNVAGAIVLAFVGWRGRLPAGAARAWLLAWPLTQLAMAAVGADRVAAAMPHYGGLSGVLHAGAIVLGLSLAWPLARLLSSPPAARWRANGGAHAGAVEPAPTTEGPWAMTEMGAHTVLPASTLEQPVAAPVAAPDRPLRERWVGVAIVAGTLAKVVLETPWQLAPRPSAALGIAVAPLAHACGVAAGLVAWGAWRLIARERR